MVKRGCSGEISHLEKVFTGWERLQESLSKEIGNFTAYKILCAKKRPPENQGKICQRRY